MTETIPTRTGRVSSALAVLCPIFAVVVGSFGSTIAHAAFLWTLSAACPIAWVASQVRCSQRRATIVAAACEPFGEDEHAERK